MVERDRDKWQEHIDATRQDSPSRFLELMDRDGVALGELANELDESGREALRSVHGYFRRWMTEAGPHPDTRPPRPVGGDLWDLKQWQNNRSGHTELLRWNHPLIKLMRGRWVAVLRRVIGVGERPHEATDESMPAEPRLGNGGPAKTLEAVGRAVRKHKGAAAILRLGDRAELAVVLTHLGDQDRKKATDYLAPSGRLCRGGWIRRERDDVILTQRGADDLNTRNEHKTS
ncbi:MAG: hypothetical protein IPM29_17200 [Planctomycetes bacterium]|nr:hypothetical protein [Planctomycetota bacterium]